VRKSWKKKKRPFGEDKWDLVKESAQQGKHERGKKIAQVGDFRRRALGENRRLEKGSVREGKKRTAEGVGEKR